jgi:hypothetical protein
MDSDLPHVVVLGEATTGLKSCQQFADWLWAHLTYERSARVILNRAADGPD